MRDFESFNRTLEVLNQAEIIDLVTHLEIRLTPKQWKLFSHGKERSISASNLSMQFGKPIRLCTKGSTAEMWWTNGVCHNPYGPSEHVVNSSGYMVKYTDENGFPHRVDGPAIEVLSGNNLVSEWRIRPGHLHRVGGPALTVTEFDSQITWGEMCKNRTVNGFYGLRQDAFSQNQPIRVFKKRAFEWRQNARPCREDNLATSVYDEGLHSIITVSPVLVPTVHSLIVKRVYTWHDEDGDISRDDGPAIVTLTNVVQKEHGMDGFIDYSGFYVEWWYKGTRIDIFDLDKWRKKHGVELHKRAPIERSAFVRPDDAFCFLTDFLPTIPRNDIPF